MNDMRDMYICSCRSEHVKNKSFRTFKLCWNKSNVQTIHSSQKVSGKHLTIHTPEKTNNTFTMFFRKNYIHHIKTQTKFTIYFLNSNNLQGVNKLAG